jgi:hypothetical protein
MYIYIHIHIYIYIYIYINTYRCKGFYDMLSPLLSQKPIIILNESSESFCVSDMIVGIYIYIYIYTYIYIYVSIYIYIYTFIFQW